MKSTRFIHHDPTKLQRLIDSKLYDVIEPKHGGQLCRVEIVAGTATAFGEDGQAVWHLENAPGVIDCVLSAMVDANTVHCFDLVQWNGQAADWPLYVRRVTLRACVLAFQNHPIKDGRNHRRFVMVDQHPIKDLAKHWQRVLDGQHQGLVLKDSTAPLGAPCGVVQTMVERNLVCVGTIYKGPTGQQEITHLVGAVFVDVDKGQVLRPMAEVQVDASKVGAFASGRVFGALFNTSGGATVAPRFKRWRDDLTPFQCQGGNNVE